MTEVRVGEALRAWTRWSSGSIEELAAIGTAFVWSLGLEPLPETTASPEISRRTIRYYISNRLVDPPEGERRLATYHYHHLLQLLYVKARQHAGDRLDEIRDDLDGASRDRLEELVLETLPKTVPAPVPDDPSEFQRPAQLEAVVRRWGYLTGRHSRYPASTAVASLAREALQPDAEPIAYSRGADGTSDTRMRAELEIVDDIWLTLPADHPLVHDEDGREFVLRGIRRLLRRYPGNVSGGRDH